MCAPIQRYQLQETMKVDFLPKCSQFSKNKKEKKSIDIIVKKASKQSQMGQKSVHSSSSLLA